MENWNQDKNNPESKVKYNNKQLSQTRNDKVFKDIEHFCDFNHAEAASSFEKASFTHVTGLSNVSLNSRPEIKYQRIDIAKTNDKPEE